MRWYVGSNQGAYEAFKAAAMPTEDTHGKQYRYVIGPLRTKQGAQFMAQCGHNNPHCQHVEDAEQLAQLHKGSSHA